MKALFTNQGNLAIIATANNNGSYITRLYHLEHTQIRKLQNLNVYECIDRPKVNEHRDSLLLEDANAQFLAFTLDLIYKGAKFALVSYNRDNSDINFYAFDIKGDIMSISSTDIIEALLRNRCGQIDQSMPQYGLIELLRSSNRLTINRNELGDRTLGNKVEELKLWGN